MLNTTTSSILAEPTPAPDPAPTPKAKTGVFDYLSVIVCLFVYFSIFPGSKRKVDDTPVAPPAKKVAEASESGGDSEKDESKFSRSGQAIKPKKFGDNAENSPASLGSPKPEPVAVDEETPRRGAKPAKGAKKENAPEPVVREEPKQETPTEPRKMWVKVKNTDDLIEINVDKDRPASFESEESRLEWKMASARKVGVFLLELLLYLF